MTQTAVLAGNEQQINFLNIFIRSKTTPDTVDTLAPNATVVNPILDWFDKSGMLEPVAFKSISAGKIFQSDRAIVKFKLSGIYHDHFVLFRACWSLAGRSGYLFHSTIPKEHSNSL